MALLNFGSTSFTDIDNVAPHKTEWGLDKLVRRVRGPSDGLAGYVAGLSQGASYLGFYLHSWTTEDRPPWGLVTLNYVGFLGGSPPDELAIDDTTIQTTSRSSSDITDLDIENDNGEAAKRATETFEFYCPQTTYKYMSTSRPVAVSHSGISNGRYPDVIRDIIRLDNGLEFDTTYDALPDGLLDALGGYLSPTNKVLGPHVDPIPGTFFFESEDVVMYGYWPSAGPLASQGPD
jgi:hypothetical protein